MSTNSSGPHHTPDDLNINPKSDVKHAVSRKQILENVGRLPPSILLLKPQFHPASMVAVVPLRVMKAAAVQDGKLANIDSRAAFVLSAESLMGTNANPPSIALLSPCLYSAISSDQRMSRSSDTSLVTLQPLTSKDQPEEKICSRITLLPLVPFPLPTKFAQSAAKLARDALVQRDAREGEVIPVAKDLWFVIESVDGKGIISNNTEVAIRVGGHRAMVKIDHSILSWARAKWIVPKCWHFSKLLSLLERASDYQLNLIVLEGMTRDVEDVLESYSVGRMIVRVDGDDTANTFMNAAARAELSEGAASIICNAEHGLSSASCAFLLQFINRDAPYAHYQGNNSFEDERSISVVLVVADKGDLDVSILQRADLELNIPSATESERIRILRKHIDGEKKSGLSSEQHLSDLGRMSTGFARREVLGLAQVYCEQGMESCHRAIAFFGKGKVTVDTGGVTWGDIGGLEKVKEQILQLVELNPHDAAKHPNSASQKEPGKLMKANRRVGVLLYGPPGTGKTLLARAVAGECGCSFISVKGPELLDMYVGESEKNVREVFSRASMAAPCVIFFDELDALAPNRGRGSDSGGVADRVVSQLLAELDEIVTRGDIFVIAASNRPDLVDPSLQRPGRLDKMIYVEMAGSREDQESILRAQTRKFSLAKDVDFSHVLSYAPRPPLLSGADLYSLSAKAWMQAVMRVTDGTSASGVVTGADDVYDRIERAGREEERLRKLEREYMGWFRSGERTRDFGMGCSDESAEEVEAHVHVEVSHADFVAAAKDLTPSLNEVQIQEYDDLRRRIETGM